MSLTVTVEERRTLSVSAERDAAFALLADIPAQQPLFPGVERIAPLENGIWQWELRPQGPPGHAVRTVYACRFTIDGAAGLVRWEPVEGIGNGRIFGEWQMKGDGGSDGTILTLHTGGTVDLPVPALLGMVVRTALRVEFRHTIDRYVANVRDALG